MKIVNFKAGLGNQVFHYLLYLYLKQRHKNENVYGYYNPAFLKNHNGLEFHKVFDVDLPPSNYYSNLIAKIIRIASRSLKWFKATDNNFSETAVYYDGWWQDKKFFLDNVKKIKFREKPLSEKNLELLNIIKNSQSVSIHIRRGDYLEPKHIKQYGGICTLDYYNHAISLVNEQLDTPHYFIFSNDIEWVKENLKIDNAIYVTNNTGADSYLDMYLMSHCKANILANSSFSYWGAMLNNNTNQIVIYPKKWFNSHTPNIFPTDWTGI